MTTADTLMKDFHILNLSSSTASPPGDGRQKDLLPRSPNAHLDGSHQPAGGVIREPGCLTSAPILKSRPSPGTGAFQVTSRDLKHAHTDHRPVALSPKEYFEMARLRQSTLASKFGGSLTVKGIRKLDDPPFPNTDKLTKTSAMKKRDKQDVEKSEKPAESVKVLELDVKSPLKSEISDLIGKVEKITIENKEESDEKSEMNLEENPKKEIEKSGDLIGRGPIQANKGKIYAAQGPYPCQPFSRGGNCHSANLPNETYGHAENHNNNNNNNYPNNAIGVQPQARMPENFQAQTPMDYMRAQREKQQQQMMQMMQIRAAGHPHQQLQPMAPVSGLHHQQQQHQNIQEVRMYPAPVTGSQQQQHQQQQQQQLECQQQRNMLNNNSPPQGGDWMAGITIMSDQWAAINNNNNINNNINNNMNITGPTAVGEFNKPMKAASMCHVDSHPTSFMGHGPSSSPRAAPSPPDIYSPSGYSVEFQDSPEPHLEEIHPKTPSPLNNQHFVGFGGEPQHMQDDGNNGIIGGYKPMENLSGVENNNGGQSPRTAQNKKQLGELDALVQHMNELPDDLSDFILAYSKPYQAGESHEGLGPLGDLMEPVNLHSAPSSSSGVSSMGSPSSSVASSMERSSNGEVSRKNSCEEISSPIGSEFSETTPSPPSVVSDTSDLGSSIHGSPNHQRAAIVKNSEVMSCDSDISQSSHSIPSIQSQWPIKLSSTGAAPRSDQSPKAGRERLRALIGSKDREQGWVWAAKCWHSAPQALCFLRDADGDTFLHKVVYHKDLAKIYALVEHIVRYEDPTYPKCFDLPNNNNETPLFVAVQRRMDEVVEYLLECGANPNIRTESNGEAPLHYAAARGMTTVVRSLIKFGDTDLNLYDLAGLTPLLSAVKYHGVMEEESQCLVNNKPIIIALLKAGANALLLEKAAGGKSILHYAAERIDPHLVEIFRESLSTEQMKTLAATRSDDGERPMDTLCRLSNRSDLAAPQIAGLNNRVMLEEEIRAKMYCLLAASSGEK